MKTKKQIREIAKDAIQKALSKAYYQVSDNPDELIVKQGGHCEKVTIGKDCYIGMNVSIMYSGSVGDGAVVGAGAVVNKKIPPYSIAVGVPARVIKERKKS